MRFMVTAKLLGVLLMLFSISMLTPIPVSMYYHNHDASPFLVAFAITLITGFVLWMLGLRSKQVLRTRDGFIIVFAMWFVLGIFGSLPFMLSYSPHIPLSDAFFETISGLTTTGATALKQIDGLPQAILYYRQQLQFLGGMGIIVLAVAVMPLIGVGGMQLYKAETTGPMKDNKLTPRITETAKALWLIYVGLNIACALAYWICGMTPFDAIGYAFATISTGGFATHDASIAYYHTDLIYIVSIIFMLLGGTNFSLHFIAFRRLRLKPYWQDAEFRAYIYIFFSLSLVVGLVLYFSHLEGGLTNAIIAGFYQVISFGTTTGFVSDSHYPNWPLFLPLLLIFVAMLGACAGSTTGGIKVIRAVLFQRQVGCEVKRLIHPNGTFPLKLGNQVVPASVMSSVWAFLSAYILIFIVLWLALMATGENMITAFSGLATCIANAGPGLGAVSNNFAGVTPLARWILSIAMLIGRLEVFTVLVLLSPHFWRR